MAGVPSALKGKLPLAAAAAGRRRDGPWGSTSARRRLPASTTGSPPAAEAPKLKTYIEGPSLPTQPRIRPEPLRPGLGVAAADLASRELRAAGCLGLQRAAKVRFTLKTRPSRTLVRQTGTPGLR